MNTYQGFNRSPVDILPAPLGSSTNVVPTEDAPRQKRTRAKRSCDMCRKKKSKCDAEVNRPCTNCKNWKTECVFLVEQKKRGPSTGYVEMLETRLKRMESLIENLARANGNDAAVDAADESPAEITPPPSIDETSNTSQASVSDAHGVHTERLESISESPPRDTDDKSIKVEDRMMGLQIQDYGTVCYMGSSSGIHLIDRHFLKGKKMRVPGEKLTFVEKVNDDESENIIIKTEVYTPEDCGIMSQPTPSPSLKEIDDNLLLDKTLTDRLVDLFFENFYLHTPYINKAQFMQTYNNSECIATPDEYLLAAICGIGARYLPEDIVYAMPRPDGTGFDVVRRKSLDILKFFETKASSIIDIAFKRSRISTLQTLLLITNYFEYCQSPEDNSRRWFVGGVAIRMAQDLGLHRSATRWNMPKHEIELRRRLWYATYLMDRWVSAELGRPITLLDHDFDVELPSDCELETPTKCGTATHESDDSKPKSEFIFKGFIPMIKLTQILGQVLQNMHTPHARSLGRRNESLVRFLDGALVRWKLNLPPDLEFNTSVKGCSTRGYVQMCYYLVLLLLHRPAITDSMEKSSTAFQSLTICANAANNILCIAESLEPNDFLQSPWSITMYTIVQSSLIFLHLSKGDNLQLKQCGFNNLLRCVRLFKRPDFRINAPAKLVYFLLALVAIALDQTDKVTHLLTIREDDDLYRRFASEVDDMAILPSVGLADINIGKERSKRLASAPQFGQNKRQRPKNRNAHSLMEMLDASEAADSIPLFSPPNNINSALHHPFPPQPQSSSNVSSNGYNKLGTTMAPNASELLGGAEFDTTDSFALMEGLLSTNTDVPGSHSPSNSEEYNNNMNIMQTQLPNFMYMSELHAPEPDSQQPKDIIQQLFQTPLTQDTAGDNSDDPSISLLNSEIAIWEAPSSMIWNDWDQYVTSLTSSQQPDLS